jgi:hypothetical protein
MKTKSVIANSCVPVPMTAQNSDFARGNRKTSPWMYFHPVSSLSSATSSSLEYLMKSFFRTRMSIVAKNPVSSSTVTHEFIMLNQ